MAQARLRVPDEVRAVIGRLHPDTKRKVRAALEAMVADPTVGEALRDPLTGVRRVRVGRWRIVYREHRGAIEVYGVGPRATIYSDLASKLGRK